MYRLKIETRNYTGCTRGTVRLKYAGSTLEELLDMSVVYANVRRTFCVVLVTVRKLFLGRYCSPSE